MSAIKLNLGCGATRLAGYVNVDKFGEPDLRYDLEIFPWPWLDDSVQEIVLTHVLEHLGPTPDVFLGVMKELYRVCKHGATIRIRVPHHRHEFFAGDPTHVRPITPMTIHLFSQKQNRFWHQTGAANSLLAFDLGVDFEVIETTYQPSSDWFRLHPGNVVDTEFLLSESAIYNNLIEEIFMVVRVIKPPASG